MIFNSLNSCLTDGFIWSFDPRTNTIEEFGHVLGLPDQPHYTPNIALDEEWGRLYFLAGNHGGGVLEDALETLTILDLKAKKRYWAGTVEYLEGCFGAVVGDNHKVYFSSFGQVVKGNDVLRYKDGKPVTRPYLLRYDPPENLNSLTQ